ncbi:hypothetical protein FRC11_001065, partial [Ceratobasidium sp. 423]
NAATKKRPSPKRVPEPAEEPTDAEADDEGDDDDEDYVPPEPKTRKEKKPSRERSKTPERRESKSSKLPKKPSKERPREKLKSKGVSIAEVSTMRPREPRKEPGRRSETPQYLSGYLARNHSVRVASESEDADQVSSDDGAGKAAARIRDSSENKKKSKKNKKRNRSSSGSPSGSSSSSSESSSSSSSSGSSSSSDSPSSSSSSSSSESSGGNAESSKAARRRRKRQKKSQKKAERKYKKLKSGWKAKQPTVYNGVANFDVFEQWVFEVDLWMHDTGFKKLEAVRHVGGFLTGKAASWYMNEVATNLREYKWMWKLYQGLFEHCFPFNYKQTLRERFHKAVQGNRSIKDFMRELRLYDKHLGDLAERESGLNPEDSTLSKMVKTALQYERAEQMRKEETKKAERLKSDYTSPERLRGDKREDKPREKKPEKPEKREKPGKSSKPERKTDSTERKLMPEEKEQYRADGRCFKCGDVGHKSRDCPKKNKAKPSHISSSAVRLKAMDDLAVAVKQIECSATKVKVPKTAKEQVAKAIEWNASVVKDITRQVPKTIIIEVLINGEPANAMLDTGSQSDLMSSTLADQLKLPKTRLRNPL